MNKAIKLDRMIREDREKWAMVAKCTTPVQFWQAYAVYLNEQNVISSRRTLIRDMALKTVEELSDTN